MKFKDTDKFDIVHLIHKKKSLQYLVHWIFQGMLYADKTEKIFRLALDLCLTIIFYNIINIFICGFKIVIVSFIIAHTFNATFNGHMYAIASNFGLAQSHQYIYTYISQLKERASNEKSIEAAAIYGSFARGEAREDSDLDVRIIRKAGFVNGLRACFFVFFERSRAFLKKIPLDIYVVDSTDHLLKLRKDETPLVLHDPNGILVNYNKIF